MTEPPTKSPWPPLVPMHFPPHNPITNDGQNVEVRQAHGERAYVFETREFSLEYDGAPECYCKAGCGPGRGLEVIGNASDPKGRNPEPPGSDWDPKKWPGLSIDGTATPRVPYENPLHGQIFYVSQTSFRDPKGADKDQRTFLDASTINYVSQPPQLLPKHMPRGDFAILYRHDKPAVAYAIVADVGPNHKVGEGSIALADALGVRVPHPNPARARYAVKGRPPITWIIIRGSHYRPKVWPYTQALIDATAVGIFARWGGTLRIADLLLTDLIGRTRLLADPGLTGRLQLAQRYLWASPGTDFGTVGSVLAHLGAPEITPTDVAAALLDAYKSDLDALVRRKTVGTNKAKELTEKADHVEGALTFPRDADGSPAR